MRLTSTRHVLRLALCATAMLWGSSTDVAIAQPVVTIPYQGIVTVDGEVLDGTVEVTFRLWSSPEAEEATWEEEQQVPFVSGRFSVMLGSTAENPIPTSLWELNEVFLSIEVNGVPLHGRQRIEPTPIAVGSARAQDFQADSVLVAEAGRSVSLTPQGLARESSSEPLVLRHLGEEGVQSAMVLTADGPHLTPPAGRQVVVGHDLQVLGTLNGKRLALTCTTLTGATSTADDATVRLQCPEDYVLTACGVRSNDSGADGTTIDGAGQCTGHNGAGGDRTDVWARCCRLE